MRFLITGGCGFIGSNLAASVLKRGDELAILDNLARTGSESNQKWLERQGSFAWRRPTSAPKRMSALLSGASGPMCFFTWQDKWP